VPTKGTDLIMNKITKRILAALLIMSSLLQVSIISYAKEEEEEEIVTTDEIVLLTNLGFVNEKYGPQNAEDIVTRAQFASMLAYLRGYDETYINVSNKFIDIPADYWCAGQIYALNEAGLIHGTSDDMFSPNTSVTYPQVIKCLVTLLGYDVRADQLGGYPNGYTSVATQLGFGRGNTTNAVNFKDLAKIIVKAMDTNILERNMTTSAEVSYTVAQDQTPLKKYNDIYYSTGVMTDNGITSLTGDTQVGIKAVTINGTVFNKGNADVEEYLGYKLKYYYKDNDGDLTLLFVLPFDTKVIKLKDDEIVNVDQSQFGIKRVYYETDEKSDYCILDEYVSLIHNGRAYPTGLDDPAFLKISQGTLTLIDNDSNGEYEVALVEEYFTVYVSGIDIDDQIIYGKYGNSLNYGECATVEFVTNDGSEASIDYISEKQVLSVYKSIDNSYAKIIICTDGLSGKVDSVLNSVDRSSYTFPAQAQDFKRDALQMKVVVDGKEISFSSEYIDAVIADYQGTCIPSLGLTYAFHFDKNGKIAAIEDPTGVQYAYLIKMNFATRGEMAGMTKVKLFLQDSTVFTTICAKNVKVNGISYKGQDDGAGSITSCPVFYENGEFKKQAIKVKLNKLGEVTDIETAQTLSDSTCGTNYGYDKSRFTQVLTGSKAYAGHGQRSFKNDNDDRYTLGSDILIFNVPPLDDFDETKLSIIPESALQEGASYDISLYDADASWTCKFAVIQAGASTDWFLAPCIVETIRNELVDGEACTVITGLESTNWVRYIVDNASAYQDQLDILAPGDIVRVVKGTGEKITNLQIILSPTRDKDIPREGNTSGDTEEWSNWFGQLYAKSDTGFTLTFDRGDTIKGFTLNGYPTNVYDVKNKKARRGSLKDLVMNCPIQSDGRINLANSDSWVYVYKCKGYARLIVVIKY